MIRYKNESERFRDNYIAVQKGIEVYRDKNNNLVSTIDELRLTNSELKLTGDSLVNIMYDEIKSMGLKIRNTERIVGIISITSGKGSTSKKDTIIKRDTVYVRASKIPINDKYLKMDVLLFKDSITYNYTYTDSLIIVLNRERNNLNDRGKERNFIVKWINPDWRYKANVKSLNENTKISDIVNIKIEKRKGLER